ncbi:hypothetical protein, partial [Streptomyces sp. NPDC056194]|uniref:hypothetical protein n=1 Tax=Streptomyces sp. NPDC056194 TaxID=3345744 RepID=UPI0035DF6F99
ARHSFFEECLAVVPFFLPQNIAVIINCVTRTLFARPLEAPTVVYAAGIPDEFRIDSGSSSCR